MKKREVSGILAQASRDEVGQIAGSIKERCQIRIVKQPQKTLVMVKARESIQKSLFYLGEVLATECMVTVNGMKGISVMAGDDFEKVTDAAIIDGFLNGQENEKAQVLQEIKSLSEKQRARREKLNKELKKSKVNFNVMGE
ncbi:MAG: phosphonate C-P lyase system protein PhnG [Hespellia sp.]|uniref:Alpha-D-ribose 1-methylphosphonate 5-triphosphate synthase subunit PhnG n=1 Tax=Hespellia stercorisuis DSM 15480 TaxID=1121950 RepID=A0A1M6JV36_9FIRM|nr:phosphonate C-P lyase system protein PhnG [Hespellia stercorisuis]MDD2979737.1 phosphonate C-P lyase system protein PhnG [Hespellia sp.]SHJ50551.1 alpha-D-ribose 1-methylphosphonate 5-triphosphate synthase subunit PhnG [Hespellia stercorisuis DSM 15480]